VDCAFPVKTGFTAVKKGPFPGLSCLAVRASEGGYPPSPPIWRRGAPVERVAPVPAHYTRIHPVTSKICRVQPEFVTQSRRPGLGAPWLARYKDDVYPHDFIIARGMKMQPPRFYDSKLSEEEINEIKRLRKQRGARHKVDNTPERLRVRETIKKARIQLLKRNLKDNEQ